MHQITRLVFFFFAILLSLPLISQNESSTTAPSLASNELNVFIDCRTNCDIDYFKSKIGYINYVRDQQLSDVHLLITRYPLANNGNRYTLNFIGKGGLKEINNSINYDLPPNSPRDVLRKGLVKHIELGLVAYLLHTGMDVEVAVENNGTEEVGLEEQHDPWNYWIFELYANGSLSKESQRRTFNLNSGFESARVTEEWRISQNFYFRGNFRKINNEEEVLISNLRRFGLYGKVVKSINQHWSVGIFDSFTSNTFNNIKAGVRVGPALEYSVFPYKDVINKEFTIAYHAGYNYRSYFEETLFSKFDETLFDQSIRVSLRLRQPWGSVFSSLVGRHFLHDLSKNNLEWNNYISFRLVKGLSFDLRAEFEIINDQLNIPKGEATLEDVLLQQRQLATNYNLFLSMGFRYNFGSTYNNVVNTRL